MSSLHRQPFTSMGEYVVRKSFIFNDRSFQRDDIFPAEELGCDLRKLRNLYNSGYLIHGIASQDSSEIVKKEITDEEKVIQAEIKKKKKAERRAKKQKS